MAKFDQYETRMNEDTSVPEKLINGEWISMKTLQDIPLVLDRDDFTAALVMVHGAETAKTITNEYYGD